MLAMSSMRKTAISRFASLCRCRNRWPDCLYADGSFRFLYADRHGGNADQGRRRCCLYVACRSWFLCTKGTLPALNWQRGRCRCWFLCADRNVISLGTGPGSFAACRFLCAHRHTGQSFKAGIVCHYRLARCLRADWASHSLELGKEVLALAGSYALSGQTARWNTVRRFRLSRHPTP